MTASSSSRYINAPAVLRAPSIVPFSAESFPSYHPCHPSNIPKPSPACVLTGISSIKWEPQPPSPASPQEEAPDCTSQTVMSGVNVHRHADIEDALQGNKKDLGNLTSLFAKRDADTAGARITLCGPLISHPLIRCCEAAEDSPRRQAIERTSLISDAKLTSVPAQHSLLGKTWFTDFRVFDVIKDHVSSKWIRISGPCLDHATQPSGDPESGPVDGGTCEMTSFIWWLYIVPDEPLGLSDDGSEDDEDRMSAIHSYWLVRQQVPSGQPAARTDQDEPSSAVNVFEFSIETRTKDIIGNSTFRDGSEDVSAAISRNDTISYVSYIPIPSQVSNGNHLATAVGMSATQPVLCGIDRLGTRRNLYDMLDLEVGLPAELASIAEKEKAMMLDADGLPKDKNQWRKLAKIITDTRVSLGLVTSFRSNELMYDLLKPIASQLVQTRTMMDDLVAQLDQAHESSERTVDELRRGAEKAAKQAMEAISKLGEFGKGSGKRKRGI